MCSPSRQNDAGCASILASRFTQATITTSRVCTWHLANCTAADTSYKTKIRPHHPDPSSFEAKNSNWTYKKQHVSDISGNRCLVVMIVILWLKRRSWSLAIPGERAAGKAEAETRLREFHFSWDMETVQCGSIQLRLVIEVARLLLATWKYIQRQQVHLSVQDIGHSSKSRHHRLYHLQKKLRRAPYYLLASTPR